MAPYVSENEGFTEEYIKTSGDPMLGLCKTSHTLGKATTRSPPGVRRNGSGHHAEATTLAPTIRVIHIFAPKIIKTDVANFRSIVQRLTGRPRKPDIARQRRARTKTVVAACAAVSSPDSSCFQDTDHHQLLSRQTMSVQGDSTFQTVLGVSCTDQGSPVRCSNNMETDNYSLTSNSMDSTFSFYSSIDSNTSNQDLLHNQGSMHSPGSDGSSSSFFSHRQVPYSLNEIPAPFFSGDFLQSTEFVPSCNNQDFASLQTTAPSALPEITSRDFFLPFPSLDYSGLASFSDLDILAGLGSTLPDLPLTLPPLVSGSNGLFYDSILMQPPLCR